MGRNGAGGRAGRRLMITLFALVGLAGPAAADTIGYADAVRILANSCGSDIERHCATAHLANFEIGTCLQRNAASLSPQCATDVVRVRDSLAARAAAQASVAQTCNRDIQRLCPTNLMQAGNGHILVCLLKAERSVSAACNTAITNAGYR